MTREEAIHLLVNATYSEEWQGNENLQTAQNMAIKALEQERSRSAEITQYRHDCEKLMEENERLKKSLEQETRWIPVSERLPLLRGLYKISDDVLITNGFEIDMGYLVERKGKIFWHYYGSEYEVDIKDEDNDATAWMPLPEPYKAERGKADEQT